MAGIGVILNRNAGKRAMRWRGNVGDKLGFVMGDPDSLRETSRIEEIDDVVRAFYDRQIDILGISGGDGSNHYVLDACHRIYGDQPMPRVAFLCGGTHNAHALSIGVRGTPERLLQEIVRRYHTRARFELTHRLLLEVDDGRRVHCGFSMAGGFLYRFYEEMILRQNEAPIEVAKLLALWAGSLAVGGRRIRRLFDRQPGRVFVGETDLGWAEFNGYSASSMEKLGMGFTPYPRASETPTTFQAAGLRTRPLTFLGMLLEFKRGRVPFHPDFRSDVVERLRVEAEQPQGYVFDGELFRGGHTIEVRVARRLELISG